MFSLASRSTRALKVSAVRAFSSKGAESHKPVLNLHGLHARYANATYVAASKAGQLEKVEGELTSLYNASKTSKQFSMFLENPMISRDDKTAYVSGLDKISPITKNLLITMAGNARLADLPKVATTFTQLMKAKRGEVDAKIISAEELSPAQLKEVQTAMQAVIPKGKSVVIDSVVDPAIVGGLQVQIGDQFLDLSVKSRIDEISRMPLN
uniref:ATP synthase subunit O, mitochondrial n=1 Tax=Amphora coffeiformis TaxID=265554 RepID=A0A7S3L5B2_9STRA|mmetsp:Transcript_13973/g.26784  ORF Transcript_13973/g.26784 Transcript_13973/m.26784 type:complete len:210 (-) Transcript_13973:56-685(-)|eukprot:scaffold8717_cov167-Amphora_coffeaeformis.AAC.8